jgi:hypothetical protein
MGRRAARRHPLKRGVEPSPNSESKPRDANGARPSGRFNVRLAAVYQRTKPADRKAA